MRIVVLCVVLSLLTFWLYRRLVVVAVSSRRWRLIGAAVLVALGVATAVGMAAGSGTIAPGPVRPISAVGLTWLGAGFYLALGIIVVGLVALGIRLVGAVLRRDVTSLRRRVVGVGTALVVAVSAVVTATGLIQASSVRVTQTDVQLSTLPTAFDGLRVAVIADTQVGPLNSGKFIADVVERVNEQRPDLVVLTGDMVDGRVDQIGSYLDPLANLRSTYGTYAVTGNHEYYADSPRRWAERWGELGINVLDNTHRRIDRDGQSLVMAGTNDRTGTAPMTPDYEATFRGVSPDDFTLMATHQPLQVNDIRGKGVDLLMSGHTHGGQIWPFHYLVRLQQPTLAGVDFINDTTVFTSRGVGTWGPPMRVGAPPEIAMLTLRRD